MGAPLASFLAEALANPRARGLRRRGVCCRAVRRSRGWGDAAACSIENRRTDGENRQGCGGAGRSARRSRLPWLLGTLAVASAGAAIGVFRTLQRLRRKSCSCAREDRPARAFRATRPASRSRQVRRRHYSRRGAVRASPSAVQSFAAKAYPPGGGGRRSERSSARSRSRCAPVPRSIGSGRRSLSPIRQRVKTRGDSCAEATLEPRSVPRQHQPLIRVAARATAVAPKTIPGEGDSRWTREPPAAADSGLEALPTGRASMLPVRASEVPCSSMGSRRSSDAGAASASPGSARGSHNRTTIGFIGVATRKWAA